MKENDENRKTIDNTETIKGTETAENKDEKAISSGGLLKQWVKETGYTHEQFAVMIDVTPQALSAWYNGAYPKCEALSDFFVLIGDYDNSKKSQFIALRLKEAEPKKELKLTENQTAALKAKKEKMLSLQKKLLTDAYIKRYGSTIEHSQFTYKNGTYSIAGDWDDLEIVDIPEFFCDGKNPLREVTEISFKSYSRPNNRNDSKVKEIIIPKTIRSIDSEAYKVFHEYGNLEKFFVHPKNPFFSSDDQGILYTKHKNVLLQCPRAVKGKEIFLDNNCNVQDSPFMIDEVVKKYIFTIKSGAFLKCDDVQSITFNSSKHVIIEENAIINCKLLRNIKFENAYCVLNPDALSHLPSLETLQINEGYLMSGAIDSCENLCKVSLGKNVLVDDKPFFNCNRLSMVTVDKDNPYITVDKQGILYDKYQTEILWIPKNIKGTVTVPSSIKQYYIVDKSIFLDHNQIVSLKIDSEDFSISPECFNGCTKLQRFIISKNNPYMRSDEQGLVYDKETGTLICCPKGKKGPVEITDGKVHAIGEQSFQDCINVTSFDFKKASVLTIENFAFNRCTNMKWGILPKKTGSIAENAFIGCNKLTLYYLGDEEEWNEYTRGLPKKLNNAKVYFYSENEPGKSGNFWHFVDGKPKKWKHEKKPKTIDDKAE